MNFISMCIRNTEVEKIPNDKNIKQLNGSFSWRLNVLQLD